MRTDECGVRPTGIITAFSLSHTLIRGSDLSPAKGFRARSARNEMWPLISGRRDVVRAHTALKVVNHAEINTVTAVSRIRHIRAFHPPHAPVGRTSKTGRRRFRDHYACYTLGNNYIRPSGNTLSYIIIMCAMSAETATATRPLLRSPQPFREPLLRRYAYIKLQSYAISNPRSFASHHVYNNINPDCS